MIAVDTGVELFGCVCVGASSSKEVYGQGRWRGSLVLNVLINVTQSADELIDQWPQDPVWMHHAGHPAYLHAETLPLGNELPPHVARIGDGTAQYIYGYLCATSDKLGHGQKGDGKRVWSILPSSSLLGDISKVSHPILNKFSFVLYLLYLTLFPYERKMELEMWSWNEFHICFF